MKTISFKRKMLLGISFVFVLIVFVLLVVGIIKNSNIESSNLAITNIGDTTATLVWTTNKEVSGRIIVSEDDNLSEGLVLSKRGKEYVDDRDIEEIGKENIK